MKTIRRSVQDILAGAFLFFVLAIAPGVSAATSELWGVHGELWNVQSRLPDFSYAGYHCGESSLPSVPPGVSVKSFGAKGDGQTDDTAAFQAALAAVTSGAIEIPPGRYVLTDILNITHAGVVLRGAGPEKTVLFFPRPLNEIKPNMTKNTGGRPTSGYSWSGGLVWFKGNLGERPLAKVIAAARRGDTALRLADARSLQVGQRIVISQHDNPDNSLAAHLYSGDPGNTGKLNGTTRTRLICRIVKMDGDEIHFDRPLRCDIELRWNPVIQNFVPTVRESGVENLAFEFPNTPYRGHFDEAGFNAVALDGVSDCWARNLRILNADSGIFVGGCFCTVQGVVLESLRKKEKGGSTGHHGFSFSGQDNLFADFDFRTQFIHDISVDGGAAGNVSAHGRGEDLCFDHHKRTDYENLFTDIDIGAGTHLWRHGGGKDLGKPCAARGTFWNLRAARPQSYPAPDFGPESINVIALQTASPSQKNPAGRWFETLPPGEIVPQDLHQAQLARRLELR